MGQTHIQPCQFHIRYGHTKTDVFHQRVVELDAVRTVHKELAVTGRDLMMACGLAPSRLLGDVRNTCLSSVGNLP